MVSLYINASLKNGVVDDAMQKIADILEEFGANYNMNKIDRAGVENDPNQYELFDNDGVLLSEVQDGTKTS